MMVFFYFLSSHIVCKRNGHENKRKQQKQKSASNK